MRAVPAPHPHPPLRVRLRTAVAAVGTSSALVAASLVGGTALEAGRGLAASTATPAAAAAPKLGVTRVVRGLSHPWDVTWVGGTMLFDQRAGGIWSKTGSGAPKRVTLSPGFKVYAHGEGGMLGMVADPAAARNRTFYTCMAVATSKGKAQGVEVWKWRLASATRAIRVKKLVTGMPLTSGRHSGCRLVFRSATMLYIGTGDSARGTNPQNLSSLGGKILRVRSDGSIPRSNPFYSRGGKAKLVWNYGHRNVQGLAKRPGRSELWSVEHGSTRDDEINIVVKKANYGWSPTPGYNEARPMTDTKRFPKALRARWRSGSPTVATSGATFLSGSRWESWNGRLAVAMLKGKGVRIFRVTKDNKITGSSTVLRGYGRIRTVRQGPDGNLWFTTDNGGGTDGIYRVRPS